MCKVIAITGPRPDKLWGDYELISPGVNAIREKLRQLFLHIEPDRVIVGMAQGIDTLAALLAIELRINFTAAIPCDDQAALWETSAQDRYYDILGHSLCKIHHTYTGHYRDNPKCMVERNHWMNNNSDLLIGVYDGQSKIRSGTYSCISHAEKIRRERIIIHPYTLEITNESSVKI